MSWKLLHLPTARYVESITILDPDFDLTAVGCDYMFYEKINLSSSLYVVIIYSDHFEMRRLEITSKEDILSYIDSRWTPIIPEHYEWVEVED